MKVYSMEHGFWEQVVSHIPQKKYRSIIEDLRMSLYSSDYITPTKIRNIAHTLRDKTHSEAKQKDICTVEKAVLDTLANIAPTTIGEFRLDDEVYNLITDTTSRITFICNETMVELDNGKIVPVYFVTKNKVAKATGKALCENKNFKSNFRIVTITTSLRSLLNDVWANEIDFEPFYQRGVVWSTEQKQSYVENLFEGRAEMRATLILKPYAESIKSGVVYELMDGKQRLNAILEFIKGEFPIYEDIYFRNLQVRDINFLLSHEFKYDRIEKIKDDTFSDSEKIRLFLELNAFNTMQSPEWLATLVTCLDDINQSA